MTAPAIEDAAKVLADSAVYAFSRGTRFCLGAALARIEINGSLTESTVTSQPEMP